MCARKIIHWPQELLIWTQSVNLLFAASFVLFHQLQKGVIVIVNFCSFCFCRRYGTRCARCGRNIQSTDWVRRAKGGTFHLACFSCSSCKRQLSTGEECGLLENRVFCRPHYDMMMENLKRAKESGKLFIVM